jgi:hypothetical protein
LLERECAGPDPVGSHLIIEKVDEEWLDRAHGFSRPYLRCVIYTGTWTVATCTTALPESDVGNVVMNIFWPMLNRRGNPALAGQPSAQSFPTLRKHSCSLFH